MTAAGEWYVRSAAVPTREELDGLDDLARVPVGVVEGRLIREATREAEDEHSDAHEPVTASRRAWRAMLGDDGRRKAAPSKPGPAVLLYQRGALAATATDRATLRVVASEDGAPVVRVEGVERDRTGEHGWSPFAWCEWATLRDSPAGEGLGLVRSWRARPRPSSATPAMGESYGQEPVWTLHEADGDALAVIVGGPEEIDAAPAVTDASRVA